MMFWSEPHTAALMAPLPALRADLPADGAAGTPRRTAASPQAPARSPGRPSPRQPAGTPPLSPRRSTTSPSLGRAAAAANAAVPYVCLYTTPGIDRVASPDWAWAFFWEVVLSVFSCLWAVFLCLVGI